MTGQTHSGTPGLRFAVSQKCRSHLGFGLARIRESLRVPRRGRGGRVELAETAQRRASLDLAIIGDLADGGSDVQRPQR